MLTEHTTSVFSTFSFKPRFSQIAARLFFSRGCFFRVSLDGLSERGTTRSLHEIAPFFKMPLPHFTDYSISVNSSVRFYSNKTAGSHNSISQEELSSLSVTSATTFPTRKGPLLGYLRIMNDIFRGSSNKRTVRGREKLQYNENLILPNTFANPLDLSYIEVSLYFR